MNSELIKLAFIDDHPALLTGLTAIFATEGRYEIVGTGDSADAALHLAASHNPDVMILDLGMPGEVFGAIGHLARSSPLLRLVIFTAFANADLAVRALEAGAHAFVLKGRPAEDLYAAIEAVLRGGTFVSPGFLQRLPHGWDSRENRRAPGERASLSARERQIVDGLLAGKTNKQIAHSLQLTEKTIKHYMTNLMNKLGVKSRLEVALAATKLQRDGVFNFTPEP